MIKKVNFMLCVLYHKKEDGESRKQSSHAHSWQESGMQGQGCGPWLGALTESSVEAFTGRRAERVVWGPWATNQ